MWVGTRHQKLWILASGEYNLEITNADLTDEGDYQCQIGQAEESAGQLSKKVHLTVLGMFGVQVGQVLQRRKILI